MPSFNESDVDKIIKLLQSKKKPLFIIGSQAMLNPENAIKFAKLLKQIGIPCYLSGSARGLLGKDDKILF